MSHRIPGTDHQLVKTFKGLAKAIGSRQITKNNSNKKLTNWKISEKGLKTTESMLNRTLSSALRRKSKPEKNSDKLSVTFFHSLLARRNFRLVGEAISRSDSFSVRNQLRWDPTNKNLFQKFSNFNEIWFFNSKNLEQISEKVKFKWWYWQAKASVCFWWRPKEL